MLHVCLHAAGISNGNGGKLARKMPDTASCTDNCGTNKGMVMMLAKSKLLFVVIFTWHFCGIHTMALAMEEAMEEATNEVKEDRSSGLSR